jgi:transposase-like protein
MDIAVQGGAPEAVEREKLSRIIRFAIGFNLQLEYTRGRNRLWKLFESFPDEDSARIYVEMLLWPNGPVCPRCESGSHVGSGTNPYRCNACDRQFTVRTETIFERSHVPLHRWLWAIVILATARRKVSSTKLAALIEISQPAASGMIRKLKAIWRNLSANVLQVLRRDLEFADFPIITWRWPFFSGRPRVGRKFSESASALTEEENLTGLPDTRSPEQKAADEALWKSKEKVRKAEYWEQKLRAGSKWAKRFARWLRLWKERQQVHVQDHLKFIPFKWITRRDCPACRFGEREWRNWEAIAVHLDLVLWEEFWNWNEDLAREGKLAEESAEFEALHGASEPIFPMDEEAARREWDNLLAENARQRAEWEKNNPDVMI